MNTSSARPQAEPAPRDVAAVWGGRVVKALLGLGLGAFFLWLSFRGLADTESKTGIAWNAMSAVLWGTHPAGVIARVLLFIVICVLRTERWRIQVRGLTGRTPALRESLAINAVGMAGIFFLPFRLGEFVRPNLGAQRGILGASAGLAATALERVIDGIVTAGMFGVVIVLMHRRGMVVTDEVAWAGWLTLAVFGGSLAFFIVAFRWRAATTAAVEKTLGIVHGALAQRVGGMLRAFLDGLACFRTVLDAAVYLLITVVYWLLNGASMWFVLSAMSIDVDPLAAFFCLCFLVVGMMVPAPPGNVGNFHAFARAALTVFGVSAAPAMAFAIGFHALNVLEYVVWAGLFFFSGDLSMASVRDATKTVSTPSAASSQGRAGG